MQKKNKRQAAPAIDRSAESESSDEGLSTNNEAELSRREMIKLSAAAAIAASVVGIDAKAAAKTSQARTPLFFTPAEFALVDELTELIIPTDDHSPGARAAQVAAYIDFRLSESWEEEPKKLWREGLKLVEQLSQEMHGQAFLQSPLEQRVALLTRVSQNEMKPQKPEEIFFKELKSRTVRAYYTSKIGIQTEMEYKGNSYLKEFVGYET